MIVSLLVATALGLTAYLAYTYPKYAALLLVGILPTYLIRLQIAGIPTTYLELSTWVIFLIYIINPITRLRLRVAVKSLPRGVVISIILFLVAALLSTAISPHLRTSLGILKGWIITPLIGALVVRGVTSSSAELRNILHALTASAVIISLLSFVIPSHEGRLVSIYDTPNSLALLLSPILAAALWQVGQESNRKKKMMLIGAVTIMAISLIGTQSVGGIMACIAALVLGIAIWLPGKRRKASLVGITFTTVVVIGILWQTGKIPYLLQSLQNPRAITSASVRWQLWSIGTELISDHPILGIGLGQFEPAYQKKLHERFQNHSARPINEFVFRDPHNWIISFWLNMGLLGLIGFTAIHVFAFRCFRQDKDTARAPYYLLLTTLLLFGLVDTIYWKNDLATLHWVALFILYPHSSATLLPKGLRI